MVIPKQGDICWVQFGHSGNSGSSGKRPAVIIQNDLLNRSRIRTTVVTLITSTLKLADVPGNVLLKKGTANLSKSSVVVVSQISTVDKSRLLRKVGTLNTEYREKVVQECQKVISLQLF